MPPVLSAFGDRPLDVREAPWIVTLEGAAAAVVAVGMRTVGDRGKLVRAAAALDDPELSTRGLVWLSVDRPDALEALPRLGAGAGVWIDVPLETYDIERKPVLQLALRQLGLRVEERQPFATVARTALSLDLTFDTALSTSWRKVADPGSAALREAHQALTGLKLKPEDEVPPLPPVLWRRHPRMPLAAAMPMTRGAASAVRPLESRDLVPFLVDVPQGNPIPLLGLSWKNGAVFAEVSAAAGGDPLPVRPLPGWPWPAPNTVPDRGIALAAFGVPGAELAFASDAKATADPWPSLGFALRYDLPALDEAFATATLPPQPPDQALPAELESPPPEPVPLAHDWVAMRSFWGEQERRHQVARVAHSYLAAYSPLRTRGAALKKRPVENLVGGLTWQTNADFTPAQVADEIPYGGAIMGDITTPASGNLALLGVSGSFSASGAALAADPEGPIEVVGYSPSSFVDDDGFLLDSRRTGWKPVVQKDGFLFRPVAIRVPGSASGVAGLATMLAPLAVLGTSLQLWCKNLPVDKNGLFAPLSAGIDFAAWQDGDLPRSVFEWRLIPAGEDAAAVFQIGRDRIPFFGFALEPLRLTACKLAMADGAPVAVESASILARLHLGEPEPGALPEGNLVVLELVRGAQGLAVRSLTGDALRFVLDSDPRVEIDAKCGWEGRLVFSDTQLVVSMYGEDRRLPDPVITPGDPVMVAWTRTGDGTITPGRGALFVDGVEVQVDAAGVKVRIDEQILLNPRAPGAVAGPGARDAALHLERRAGAAWSLDLLGLSLAKEDFHFEPFHFEPLDGAFGVTVARAKLTGASLLPGFPVDGTFSLGILARLGPLADGRMELTAGYLDGEVLATPAGSPRVALRRVAFRAACPGTGDWVGAIRLFGRIELDSAIGWPGVKGGDLISPVPRPGLDPDGRIPRPSHSSPDRRSPT